MIAPRYEVVKSHAHGGLGEVLVARDRQLNRNVALKRIREHVADNETARSRFVFEAEVTGRLEHPGIVPVYGMANTRVAALLCDAIRSRREPERRNRSFSFNALV